MKVIRQLYSVFTHVASIYADFLEQKKAFTEERVQLPQDWFGRPTWPQFYCKNALYSCACKV